MTRYIPRLFDQSVLHQLLSLRGMINKHWTYIKFTKDVCTYQANSGSLKPLTELRKQYYLLRSYIANARRRKIDVYGSVGISLVGEIWLRHNAVAH